jgi:hypothetical protein
LRYCAVFYVINSPEAAAPAPGYPAPAAVMRELDQLRKLPNSLKTAKLVRGPWAFGGPGRDPVNFHTNLDYPQEM